VRRIHANSPKCLAHKLIADRSRFKHANVVRVDALEMAIAAEQSSLQRVASLVRFVGQLHVARLAHVAVDVEVLVHRHHPNGFLGVGVGVLHGCDA
jgi:hypothetical protein